MFVHRTQHTVAALLLVPLALACRDKARPATADASGPVVSASVVVVSASVVDAAASLAAIFAAISASTFSVSLSLDELELLFEAISPTIPVTRATATTGIAILTQSGEARKRAQMPPPSGGGALAGTSGPPPTSLI